MKKNICLKKRYLVLTVDYTNSNDKMLPLKHEHVHCHVIYILTASRECKLSQVSQCGLTSLFQFLFYCLFKMSSKTDLARIQWPAKYMRPKKLEFEHIDCVVSCLNYDHVLQSMTRQMFFKQANGGIEVYLLRWALHCNILTEQMRLKLYI